MPPRKPGFCLSRYFSPFSRFFPGRNRHRVMPASSTPSPKKTARITGVSSPVLGVVRVVGLGVAVGLGVTVGFLVGVGFTVGLGETEGLGEGETEGLGDTDGSGETEGLGEGETEGLGDTVGSITGANVCPMVTWGVSSAA